MFFFFFLRRDYDNMSVCVCVCSVAHSFSGNIFVYISLCETLPLIIFFFDFSLSARTSLELPCLFGRVVQLGQFSAYDLVISSAVSQSEEEKLGQSGTRLAHIRCDMYAPGAAGVSLLACFLFPFSVMCCLHVRLDDDEDD